MKFVDRDGTPLATVANVVDKALADPEYFPCKFQKLARRVVSAAKKGVRGDVSEDTVGVFYDWLRDPASELRVSLNYMPPRKAEAASLALARRLEAEDRASAPPSPARVSPARTPPVSPPPQPRAAWGTPPPARAPPSSPHESPPALPALRTRYLPSAHHP